MNRTGLIRFIDATFRRWPFYLLPLLGMIVFGVASTTGADSTYTSSGALLVRDESFVAAQSGIRAGGTGSYLSPAEFIDQELQGLLNTGGFMDDVIAGAEIELAEDPLVRADQVAALRQSVTTFPASEGLIQIQAQTLDSGVSARLAQAVMDQYIEFVIARDVLESQASEAFFEELSRDYQQEAIDSSRAVDNFLRGIGTLEELTPSRQISLDRLTSDQTLANERFLAAQQNLEESRLSVKQAETSARQSFRVLDEAREAIGPDGNFVGQVMNLAMFFVAGLVLALLGPTIATVLNRGVIVSEDLQGAVAVPVVAVIPKLKRHEHLLWIADQPTVDGHQEQVHSSDNSESRDPDAYESDIYDAVEEDDEYQDIHDADYYAEDDEYEDTYDADYDAEDDEYQDVYDAEDDADYENDLEEEMGEDAERDATARHRVRDTHKEHFSGSMEAVTTADAPTAVLDKSARTSATTNGKERSRSGTKK